MPQFFIKSSDIGGNKCIIGGDDFHHLRKARRVKPGDSIDLRDESGRVYKGVVIEIGREFIKLEIYGNLGIKNSMPVNIILFAAILKGKTFDLALQKATEVGVSRIVPVITERTIPVVEKAGNKKARWEKIVAGAAKQSMRRDIPVVENPLSFKDAVLSAFSAVRLIGHPEEGGTNLKDSLSAALSGGKTVVDEVSILIGPEGGFSDSEIAFAVQNGWHQVRFSFTSLRAETASIVLPAIVIYEWSNIGEHKG